MQQVLVPFAQGVEEIEFVAVVDILRRAGVKVCTASSDGQTVVGRSQIAIVPDMALDAALGQSWALVVLPGGMPNADLLRRDARLAELLRQQHAAGRPLAAICAAPVALAAAGVIGHRRITSYPSMRETLLQLAPQAHYIEEAVVEDGQLITSRGAGTAVAFALTLVRRLCGEAKSDEVRRAIVG